jgi:hypothetical protein
MPVSKYALMYPADVGISRESALARTEMKEFKTFIGMCWFIFRNKQARSAALADRLQMFTITK